MECNPYKTTYAVIVAAGSGSRFGSALPKQYCLLAGRPVLMHTIERFAGVLPLDNIIVVISPAMQPVWLKLCADYHFTSPRIVCGGDTRHASVKNAIAAIPSHAEIIMVHDGARPLVSSELIRRAASPADDVEALVPATPLSDSIRRLMPCGTSTCANRADFVAVQTPQSFRASLLRNAYARPWSADMTDDASVAEAAGADITIFPGETSNIKITNPGDIAIAEALLCCNSSNAT